MRKEIVALLVHDQAEPMQALAMTLRDQGVRVYHVRTWQAAAHELKRTNPPHLVFSDTALPDCNWTDIVLLAGRASQPVNVIVVTRVLDTKLYLETLEGGAFDFIVPPFASLDLAHVVRCAADNVQARREAAQTAGHNPLFEPVVPPLGEAAASPISAKVSDLRS
jgi:DNA-binding NtrC family response regulator